VSMDLLIQCQAAVHRLSFEDSKQGGSLSQKKGFEVPDELNFLWMQR